MTRLRLAGWLAGMLLVATCAPTALAATAARTIATLNAQRVANGIPAGITENPSWSADCAAHDRYMAANKTLTHTEVVGKPGYTDGTGGKPNGAWAGQHAVLTQGGNWDSGNPYEYAPLHLDQLLAPRLLTLGSADAEGYSCTTTFPGWTRADPAAMTVYTYPGNGATIYPSEIARELPWTPGDLVGLTQPGRTGPTLIVLADAPTQFPAARSATLSGATVSGPSGPVQIKTVDGATPLPAGSQYPTLANYISPGGFIVPLRPLVPGTRYSAHVTVTFGAVQKSYDWSFTTLGADPHSSLTAQAGKLAFSSQSHQPIRVTFKRAGGAGSPAITIRPGRSARLKLIPGTWRACGHQAPAGGYSGYDQCITVTVTGVPALRLGKPAVRGAQIRVSLRFSPILRGRAATETITTLTQQCVRGACRTVTGQVVITHVRLRRKSLTLPLPASGQGFEIQLRTSAFQVHGASWSGAHASVVFIRH